jgi:hypothetical protein
MSGDESTCLSNLELWSGASSWQPFITSCYWINLCNTSNEFKEGKKYTSKVHAMVANKYEVLSLNLNVLQQNELIKGDKIHI